MGQLGPGSPPDGSTIGLDTFVLIYFLERHEVHYPAARLLLERIESGRLTAVVSTIVS
jgi:predicted nucleic acid-binding protein